MGFPGVGATGLCAGAEDVAGAVAGGGPPGRCGMGGPGRAAPGAGADPGPGPGTPGRGIWEAPAAGRGGRGRCGAGGRLGLGAFEGAPAMAGGGVAKLGEGSGALGAGIPEGPGVAESADAGVAGNAPFPGLAASVGGRGINCVARLPPSLISASFRLSSTELVPPRASRSPPGSRVSRKRASSWPKQTLSPGFNWDRWTLWSLTKVPLDELRSTTS